MFHPTFLTSDRDKMAKWLERVFRRQGVFQRELMEGLGASTECPSDYSFYLWVSDVQLDVIQPDLYRLPGIAPVDIPLDRLAEISWHVRDPEGVYQAARKHGVRVFDQSGRLLASETIPDGTSPITPKLVLIWLDPRDVGLGVELAQMTPDIRAHNATRFYPPFRDDWTHPEVQLDDPLGLVRCSHHTVITKNISRALLGSVTILGGEVLGSSHNDWLASKSTFVFLAGSMLKYVEIDRDAGPLQREWQPAPSTLGGHRQEDIYHAITFQVVDVEKAIAHLTAEGIGFEYQSPTLVVTDPKDCLGMRWGFTSKLVVNDPRARQNQRTDPAQK